MLIHGVAPDDMYSSTIIKGKHANVTDSINTRSLWFSPLCAALEI